MNNIVIIRKRFVNPPDLGVLVRPYGGSTNFLESIVDIHDINVGDIYGMGKNLRKHNLLVKFNENIQ